MAAPTISDYYHEFITSVPDATDYSTVGITWAAGDLAFCCVVTDGDNTMSGGIGWSDSGTSVDYPMYAILGPLSYGTDMFMGVWVRRMDGSEVNKSFLVDWDENEDGSWSLLQVTGADVNWPIRRGISQTGDSDTLNPASLYDFSDKPTDRDQLFIYWAGWDGNDTITAGPTAGTQLFVNQDNGSGGCGQVVYYLTKTDDSTGGDVFGSGPTLQGTEEWRVYCCNIVGDESNQVVQLGPAAAGSGLAFGSTTHYSRGQEFVAPATMTVDGGWALLAKVGSPDGYARMALRSTLGGSDLAYGEISGSSITSSPVWYYFDFGTPYEVTGDNTYYVVFYRSNTVQPGDYYWIYGQGFGTDYLEWEYFTEGSGGWGSGSSATTLSAVLMESTGATVVSGAASLAGAGATNVSSLAQVLASLSISGTSTSSIDSILQLVSSANISGTSTLSAAAETLVIIAAAATLAASGDTQAAALLDVLGAAAVQGVGSSSMAGIGEIPTAAALSGSSSIQAATLDYVLSSSNIAGLGAVSVPGLSEVLAAASVTGTGTVTADAFAQVLAAALLTPSGSVLAAGDIVTGVIEGAASVSLAGTVSVDSVLLRLAAAALSGTSQVTVAGLAEILATSSISGTGAVSATSILQVLAAAGVSATSSVSIAAVAEVLAAAAVTASGSVQVDGELMGTVTAAVSIALSGSADITSILQVLSAASLSGASSTAAAAILQVIATMVIATASAVAAAGRADVLGAATISGSSAAEIDSLVEVLSAASVSGVGTVDVSGLRMVIGVANLQTSGAVQASGLAEILAAANVTAAGSVSGASYIIVNAAAALDILAALQAAGSVFGEFGPPNNLQAVPMGFDRIDLSWDPVSGADGYDIERDSVIIVILHGTESYSDQGLDSGVEYDYRVRSVRERV